MRRILVSKRPNSRRRVSEIWSRQVQRFYERKKKETPVICVQLFFTTSPYCIVPSFALPWKMHYGESRLTCTHNIISIQKIYRSVKEIQLYSGIVHVRLGVPYRLVGLVQKIPTDLWSLVNRSIYVFRIKRGRKQGVLVQIESLLVINMKSRIGRSKTSYFFY